MNTDTGRREADRLSDDAVRLLNDGRWEEALALLGRALALEPKNAGTYVRRANALLLGGRLEEALSDLTQASSFGALSAEGLLCMGEILERRQDLERSAAVLASALKLDPGLDQARFLLGKVLHRLGRPEQARAVAASAPPDRLRLLVGQGRVADAEQDLKGVLGKDAGDYTARMNLGNLLQDEARFPEAREQFEAACAQRPAAFEARCCVAEIWMQMGDAAAARRAYQEAFGLAGRTDMVRHRLERFQALMGAGRFEEAFREGEGVLDHSRALEDVQRLGWPWGKVWPDLGAASSAFAETLTALAGLHGAAAAGPWARFFRGVLIRRTAKPDDGNRRWLAEFEGLSGSDVKRYGWMRYEAGFTRLQLGDFPGALLDFEAALAGSEPGDWRAHGYRAEAFLCRGDLAAALAEFAAAEKIAPDLGEAYAWKGALQLWAGRYEDAVKTLDEAAARGARYAYCWRGGALIMSGKPAEALADLERALQLKTWDQEALLWRAEAKRLLGRPREALDDLERCTPTYAVHCNRGLAWAALGEPEAMRNEFELVKREIIGWVRRRLGKSGGVIGDPERVEILEAALRFSAGCRRGQGYEVKMWMR